MNLDQYRLSTEEESTIFKFESLGPKGKISKAVQFDFIEEYGFYNLAFGDFNQLRGNIDDSSVSNNGDTDKVLATVVAALFRFLEVHPNAIVYATGSSPSRTRLYQIGIFRYYQQASDFLTLFGELNGKFVPFVPNMRYTAFLVRRK